MLRIVLVRPGATDFDDQGRMKGSLDMPLSDCGRQQANRIAKELAGVALTAIYTAPCESARETANRIADGRSAKVKVIESFRNIDHGLWHGKLIDEVRRNQPKVYRQGQDAPVSVCPPEGETLQDASARVLRGIHKICKRADGVIALVIPDPLASVAQSVLEGEEMGDLWKAETDAGQWELLEAVV